MAAVVLKDRVKETTSTTGTADFVLGGAASGYQPFSVIGPNNYTYYCCFDNATGDWEVGYGQYTTTAGGTLVRNTILSNSAATTSKISFGAGAKDVFLTYPAEKGIYEELNGNTLIDGGPLTVVGSGVTGYTTFSAALAELYGDVDSFAQLYAQNLNDGSSASADLVAYNDLGDGLTNFVDMGINSSNYTSVDYPIFTPASAYLFNDGGELFLGSATDDVVLFAGGVDTTDEAVRISAATKAVTTVGDVNVGAALDVTGAATFGSTVLLDADPTLALQAATKQYVDNATSNGFHVHQPVLVATTGNLTATYNNGTAGVGATLTNSGAQAALSIDGVSMTVADRVLVWQQTSGLQNGVYVVTTVGSGATNWVLTRSSDADTSSEGDPNSLGGGDYFFVQSGTTLGYHSYICVNTSTITFGTTSIDFNEFSSVPQYTGTAPINVSGNVIALTGTVAATNGGTGTSTVTTGDLLYGSATNTWSKLAAGSAYKSLVMNAGGTNVEWNAVALNQSGAVSGALPAINGGTGQNAYAVGDVLYSGTTDTLSRLAGNTTTTKKFLGQTGTGSASAAPSWQQPAATDITGLAASATTDTTNASNISSGTLGTARLSGSYTGITGVGTLAAGTWNGSTIAAAYGGTGQSSYAVGDLLYASTTTALSKLADVAVGNALISGGVGSAPSYGKIGLATHVSGTLPVANGGTGVTSSTGSGSVVLSAAPALTGNVTLTSGTTGVSTGFTVINGDITTYRSGGTTGVIYFGTSGSKYLYYDGTNYSMPGGQLDVNGSRVLNAGNYTSYSPSLTGSGASGTWSINVTGSSGSLNGYVQNNSGGANTIVQRDGSGYIQNSYFYTSSGGAERNASGMGYFAGFNSSDYYIRSYTPAAVASAISGQTMNINGSSTSCSGNAATATKLSTASGSAPSYSARAWVNFNGTGTVAIRGSGNVSSITDGGVGDYTMNFSTAMPDTVYATTLGGNAMSGGSQVVMVALYQYNTSTSGASVGSIRLWAQASGGGGSNTDLPYFNAVVFR